MSTVRLAFELRIQASAQRTFEVMTQQPGTILDTDYRLREEAGAVVVSVTKVATGPMTDEEAAGIARFGDLTRYAPAIQKLAAS